MVAMRMASVTSKLDGWPVLSSLFGSSYGYALAGRDSRKMNTAFWPSLSFSLVMTPLLGVGFHTRLLPLVSTIDSFSLLKRAPCVSMMVSCASRP